MARNKVAANCAFIGDVELGVNNIFEPGVVVSGPAQIGSNNYFGANAVVGTPPRQLDRDRRSNGVVIVGDDNYFGESVRVHRPVVQETKVGNFVAIGAGSHVGHDCRIGSNINISVNCSIGGYSVLLDHCNIGMSVCIHPRTVIGPWGYAGMGSVVTSNVQVGSAVVGSPAKHIRWNYEAFKRSRLSSSEINELRHYLDHGLYPVSPRLIFAVKHFSDAVAATRRNPVLRTWDELDDSHLD